VSISPAASGPRQCRAWGIARHRRCPDLFLRRPIQVSKKKNAGLSKKYTFFAVSKRFLPEIDFVR
jgi:hypothetical protein